MPEPGRPPRLVLAVGAPADARAADRRRDGDRRRRLDDAQEAGAVLDAELPRLATGWRVLVVGTGRDVATVRAAALARGALDEEVEGCVLEGGDLEHGDLGGGEEVRVHCGVCHHRFGARVGDLPDCPGCGAALVVTDHDSRTHGAVLGAPR